MATVLTPITSASSYGPSNWSDLPDELLHPILLRLSHTRDLLAFSSVCRSWRSFAISTISDSPTPLFPPLLVCPLLAYRSRRRRRLISSSLKLLDPAFPPTNTIHVSPVEESTLSLPFLSSSHGHLLFLTRRWRILIVNFITGQQITSPVLPLDHHLLFDSPFAQLTAPVSSPSCTLIFLTIDCLLFWKINSPDWILRPVPDNVFLTDLNQMIIVGSEMIVVGERIWVLELGDMLYSRELPQDLCLKELEVKWPEWDILPSVKIARLVDCKGEILCVCFFANLELGVNVQVEVYGFDMFNDHVMLVKKNNLGSRALLLSAAVNVPGCVCNDPERWGGKNNCIYYAWSAKENWLVLEVGGLAPKSVLEQTNRSTCSFPFWDYASILQ